VMLMVHYQHNILSTMLDVLIPHMLSTR
jgi:hypothetical protein